MTVSCFIVAKINQNSIVFFSFKCALIDKILCLYQIYLCICFYLNLRIFHRQNIFFIEYLFVIHLIVIYFSVCCVLLLNRILCIKYIHNKKEKSNPFFLLFYSIVLGNLSNGLLINRHLKNSLRL